MTVTIDKKQSPTFKTFYEIVYKELDGKNLIDWEECENMHYHADLLNEFLWYVNDMNIDFVLLNTDVEKIKEEKTYDDYEWNLIIEILTEFVMKYPNNTLTIFKGETDNLFFS